MTPKKPDLVYIRTPLDEHTPEKCSRDANRMMDADDAGRRLPHYDEHEEPECRCTTEEVESRPWGWDEE